MKPEITTELLHVSQQAPNLIKILCLIWCSSHKIFDIGQRRRHTQIASSPNLYVLYTTARIRSTCICGQSLVYSYPTHMDMLCNSRIPTYDFHRRWELKICCDISRSLLMITDHNTPKLNSVLSVIFDLSPHLVLDPSHEIVLPIICVEHCIY